mmetsp:Transcript_6779/g.16866  ORF Transcript_6779/g.16866 Transcript_6779/m.16866 type:complete len:509 (-) Transcript_6779:79-1605(-)
MLLLAEPTRRAGGLLRRGAEGARGYCRWQIQSAVSPSRGFRHGFQSPGGRLLVSLVVAAIAAALYVDATAGAAADAWIAAESPLAQWRLRGPLVQGRSDALPRIRLTAHSRVAAARNTLLARRIARKAASEASDAGHPARKARVVFLGSPDCVLDVLRALQEASQLSQAGFELSAVVTQPPKKVGRGKNMPLTKTPVHELAASLGVESILAPASARDEEFLEQFEALEPDICVTAAYGQSPPRRFLKAPRLGTLNLHPSLLPRWRGASPVQRALAAGDTETGITILYTVAKMDAGPIALQKSMQLQGNETSPGLLPHLFKWGAGLLVDEVLPKVLSGQLSQQSAEPQEEALVTNAPMIVKEEGMLWPHNESAVQMRDKIRGFAIWPGTTLPIACSGSTAPPRGFRAKVFGVGLMSSSELPLEDRSKPVDELLFVRGQDGRPDAVGVRPAVDPENVLLLQTVHLPAKSEVPAKTFYKGYMQKQPARWIRPEEEELMMAKGGGSKKRGRS